MIIQDEYNNPMIINDFKSEITSRYMWIFDLKFADYMLFKFQTIEEHTCPTYHIEINGRVIKIPANWFMLVADPFTMQVDTIPVSLLALRTYHAFSYGQNHKKPFFPYIKVLDYVEEDVTYAPFFNRQMMLVHDVGDGLNCCVGYADSYSKYIKTLHVDELL